MRLGLIPLTLFSLVLLPARVKADTFSFSAAGSGGGFSGSGVLTAASNGDGSYTIGGITGSGVTGLIAPNGFFFNDNLLFPTASRLVDVAGFAFTAMQGGMGYSVNIFSTLNGYEAITLDADGDYTDAPVTFALSGRAATTPEPSSLLLLGSGLSSMAAVLRRRKRLA